MKKPTLFLVLGLIILFISGYVTGSLSSGSKVTTTSTLELTSTTTISQIKTITQSKISTTFTFSTTITRVDYNLPNIKVDVNPNATIGAIPIMIIGMISPNAFNTQNGYSVLVEVINPKGIIVAIAPESVDSNGAFSYNFTTGGTYDWIPGTYNIIANINGIRGFTTFVYTP